MTWYESPMKIAYTDTNFAKVAVSMHSQEVDDKADEVVPGKYAKRLQDDLDVILIPIGKQTNNPNTTKAFAHYTCRLLHGLGKARNTTELQSAHSLSYYKDKAM